MVILGLLLVAAGVIVILAGVFTAEVVGTPVEVLGIGISPVTLFVLGVVAALAVLVGLWFARAGTRRTLKARREHKRLEELSDKLDAVEAERRRDPDEDRDGH